MLEKRNIYCQLLLDSNQIYTPLDVYFWLCYHIINKGVAACVMAASPKRD